MTGVSIEPLARHPEAHGVLGAWFEAEWPSHYGPAGPGNAAEDLQRYANIEGLPFGVVALCDGSVYGAAALKADSIATHRHLSPWVAAGIVRPDLRGRGIGTQLVAALERRAKVMGFTRIYCGTSKATGVLERLAWRLSERIIHEGEVLGIYAKAL
jgi:GNAT superfamily N-acetyltransferase